jgi:hypothetical protein
VAEPSSIGPDGTGRQETDVFLDSSAQPGTAGSPRRSLDPISLVAGLVFAVLGLLVVLGVDLPDVSSWGGGLVWLVLVGAGIALLVTELRRARRRR